MLRHAPEKGEERTKHTTRAVIPTKGLTRQAFDDIQPLWNTAVNVSNQDYSSSIYMNLGLSKEYGMVVMIYLVAGNSESTMFDFDILEGYDKNELLLTAWLEEP
jgi:hypothetical protein